MSKNGILRTLRLEKRFSKEELCEIFNKEYGLKINENMISKWERGQDTPRGTYLSAYAKYFNISSEYISSLIKNNIEEKEENIIEKKSEDINIIKKLREEQGLSQEELANLVGYKNKNKIEEMEEGLSFIPASKLSKFAKVLKISKDALVENFSEESLIRKSYMKPDVVLETGEEIYFDIINSSNIVFHYFERFEEKSVALTGEEMAEFNKSMEIVNILFDSPYITKYDIFDLKREALKCYVKTLMSKKLEK